MANHRWVKCQGNSYWEPALVERVLGADVFWVIGQAQPLHKVEEIGPEIAPAPGQNPGVTPRSGRIRGN